MAFTQITGDPLNALAPGWQLLATATASSSTEIDFTSVITTTYNVYMCVIDGATVSVDDREIWLRTSTDNGATFQAGVSDYNVNMSGTLSSSVTTDTALDKMVLTHTAGVSQQGNVSDESFNAVFYIYNPTNSALMTIIGGSAAYTNPSGNSVVSNFSGNRHTAEDNDAIRILPETGNFVAGTFKLYGVA